MDNVSGAEDDPPRCARTPWLDRAWKNAYVTTHDASAPATRSTASERQIPLWEPAESAFTDSNLARFALATGHSPRDYDALHRWSISDRSAFWRAVWEFTGVIGHQGERAEVLPDEQTPPREGHMFGASWFPDARLNFAENLLRGESERAAVIAADERGVHTTLTLGDLRRRVAGAQNGLRGLGIGQGDVVAGILPNTIDALVAMLATTSLGATWAGCSPDFGDTALIDRIGQLGPKAIVAVDDYMYNGTRFPIADHVTRLVEHLDRNVPVVVSGTTSWTDTFGDLDAPLTFERFPFDNPLVIMFTSGTTGLPKCIVHSTGGVLLQHLKEHVLHGDVRKGDVHSWFTSTAWMMYGWVVSALAAEAAVVLIDGSPIPRDYVGDGPACEHLWRIADDAGITHFGTSPRYLTSLEAAGYFPGDHFPLTRLRSVLAAGAPVSAEQYRWVYEHIKRDQILASISGGTEIHGCFMLGSPLHPVYAGEISCIGLGMAVNVLDDRNAPVIGAKAELVCTEPFPSAPLTFEGVDGDARFHAAYFSQRDDIWTHGDLAEITERATVVVYGRSDTTLKPSGVRIGTAEIYRVLDARDDIVDSIVFGRTENNNEDIVLCVVLPAGLQLTDELAASIRLDIRRQTSPRHVPRYVFAVRAVPYTFNGKKVEGAAKAISAGEAVENVASLGNPECLVEYAELFT